MALTEIVVDIMKEGGVKFLQSAASEVVLDRLMNKAHGPSALEVVLDRSIK